MDPISAFSLAVNVLTVVDLSAKLLSIASEIRSSGDTISNQELAADAQRLKSCCQKFSSETAATSISTQQNDVSSISSEDDATLRLLASEAKEIAGDVQESLLKLNKHRRFLRVFRQSIQNTLRESEMKKNAERLKEIQNKIMFTIIASIKPNLNTLALAKDEVLTLLNENTKSLIQAILADNDITRSKMETQMAKFQTDITSNHAQMMDFLSDNDVTQAKMETQVDSLHTDVKKNHVQVMESAIQRHDELLSAIRVRPAQNETAEDLERVTKRILDRLWFPKINDRYEDIEPAHKKTFEWIFSAEMQLGFSCSFFQWIERGSGLYWISGRAGTGKSTLMKFIADHKHTKALLQHWTKGSEYITAKYWFWDQSPDPLQKSMEGLYRGLLFDVIKQKASLAPLLFPDEFNPERELQSGVPTLNWLRRAFNRLVSMEASTVLVVLLIDGLDEYQATEIDQLSLADSLKAAAQSKHMKIIATSRPETVFENAFGDCNKLYLHDLTYSDRTNFAKDSLYKHTRMKYLGSLAGGKKDADELIYSAVEKSEGIFLWLRLVVDSLIQELDACDTIKDLQHVFTQFPRGLEKLFLHMMGRIRQDRRQRGLLGLLIAQRALRIHATQSPRNTNRQTLGLSRSPALTEMEPYKFSLTAICLDGAYTELNRIANLRVEPLSDAAGQDALRKVENRLRSWCAGLLELGPPCRSVPLTAGQNGTQLGNSSAGFLGQYPRYSDLEVRFMHRSIAEFLDLPSTRADMINTISSPAFDVDLFLMKGLLVKVKRDITLWGFGSSSAIWHFVELILRVARHIEDAHTDAVIAILTDLDRTLTSAFTKSMGPLSAIKSSHNWTEHFPCGRRLNSGKLAGDYRLGMPIRRPSFLSIAVESGLAVFTLKLLETPEKQLLVKSSKGVPLLSLACRPPPFSFVIPGVIRPEIIRKLLELGADPNQSNPIKGYNDERRFPTPWECMLQTAIDLKVVSIKGAEQLSDILMMLIIAGADLEVKTNPKTSSSVSLEKTEESFFSDYQKHHPLGVEDVVRYAFLLGTLPPSSTTYHDVSGAFVPFQEADLSWGMSDGQLREDSSGMFLEDAQFAKVTDKKAIQEMGYRLLELIQLVSTKSKSPNA